MDLTVTSQQKLKYRKQKPGKIDGSVSMNQKYQETVNI